MKKLRSFLVLLLMIPFVLIGEMLGIIILGIKKGVDRASLYFIDYDDSVDDDLDD